MHGAGCGHAQPQSSARPVGERRWVCTGMLGGCIPCAPSRLGRCHRRPSAPPSVSLLTSVLRIGRCVVVDRDRCLLEQLGSAEQPMPCLPSAEHPMQCQKCPLGEHSCHIPNAIDSDELQEGRYYRINEENAAKIEAVYGFSAKQAVGCAVCRHAFQRLKGVPLPPHMEEVRSRGERAKERSASEGNGTYAQPSPGVGSARI